MVCQKENVYSFVHNRDVLQLDSHSLILANFEQYWWNLKWLLGLNGQVGGPKVFFILVWEEVPSEKTGNILDLGFFSVGIMEKFLLHNDDPWGDQLSPGRLLCEVSGVFVVSLKVVNYRF